VSLFGSVSQNSMNAPGFAMIIGDPFSQSAVAKRKLAQPDSQLPRVRRCWSLWMFSEFKMTKAINQEITSIAATDWESKASWSLRRYWSQVHACEQVGNSSAGIVSLVRRLFKSGQQVETNTYVERMPIKGGQACCSFAWCRELLANVTCNCHGRLVRLFAWR